MSKVSELIDSIVQGDHLDDVLEKDINELTSSGSIATRLNVKPKRVNDLDTVKDMVKSSDNDLWASLHLLKNKTKDKKKKKKVEAIIEEYKRVSKLVEEID